MSFPAGRKRSRHAEINRKHKRRAKIKKLKVLFAKAKNDAERKKIFAKAHRIAPFYPAGSFQIAEK